MTTLTTIKFQAFGYEHEFSDSYTAEEIDILENAPVLMIVSAIDEKITDFEKFLEQDQYLYWTEAGEAILFCYEDLTIEQYSILEVLDIAYEQQERH